MHWTWEFVCLIHTQLLLTVYTKQNKKFQSLENAILRNNWSLKFFLKPSYCNDFNHFKFSKMKGASVAKRRDSLTCFCNLIIRCTHFYCSLLLAPWQGLEIGNCKMKWWLCEHVDVMFVIFHIWSLLLYPRFKNNKNFKK